MADHQKSELSRAEQIIPEGHSMTDHSAHAHDMEDMSMTEHSAPIHDMEDMSMSNHAMTDSVHSMPGHEMSDMDLMEHGGHMTHMGNMRQKLWLAVLLTLPLLLISPIAGFTLLKFPGSGLVQLLLGSIIYFYCGRPFFNGAKSEWQSRQPAMMMLISLGITVAYFYSVYATILMLLGQVAMNFWFELSTLIVIMLAGHLIEMRAIMGAGDALADLASLLPKKAHLKSGEEVTISSLQPGDVLLVKENEKVPADGQIAGSALIDESMLTGESRAVEKQAGDPVYGGALNQNYPFEMTVTSVGSESFLSQVVTLVKKAQAQKSALENMADKVAGALFWAALIAGLGALIFWSLSENFSFALLLAVSVFVIACPHALGLAVPLVVARLTSLSAKQGLLIQNRTALEGIERIHYALMDKTGTLTDGKFKLRGFLTLAPEPESELLQIAAALEAGSTHPIAQALIEAAKLTGEPPLKADKLENQPGVGVTGEVAGQNYQIISLSQLSKLEASAVLPSEKADQSDELDTSDKSDKADKLDESAKSDKSAKDRLTKSDYPAQTSPARVQEFLDQGLSVSALLSEGQILAYLALGDSPKADSASFIKQLKAEGITPVMLTGDNYASAEKMAQRLGITDFRAELKPQDKADLVQTYQAKAGVLFIGDGVNDSPALATADIGIAIGAGTSVAINSADVVLVNSQPSDVLELIAIAKAMRRKMRQNLWFGAGYNLLAIPIAAGLLYPTFGLTISPLFAAVLMSLSTVIVSLNAMGLKYRPIKLTATEDLT